MAEGDAVMSRPLSASRRKGMLRAEYYNECGTKEVMLRPRDDGGKKRMTILYGTRSITGDPGFAFSYRVRRLLRPIRVAPVKVYDGAGTCIALITTDPVTGERRREPC